MGKFRDSFAAYMIGAGALAATPAANAAAQDISRDSDDPAVTVQSTTAKDNVSEGIGVHKENARTDEEMFRDLKEVISSTKFADWYKEEVSRSNTPRSDDPKKLTLTPVLRLISTRDIDSVARSNPLEDNLSNLDTNITLQDYQSVCAYRCVEETSQKLMALYAQGKKKEANAILPKFSRRHGKKIERTTNNISMSREDWDALKNNLIKKFNKVFPDFDKQTQAKWETGEEFRAFGAVHLNDNQFINLAATKTYDVTNPENRELAAKTRQQYNDVVNNSKTKTAVKDKSKTADAQTQKRTKALSVSEIVNAYRNGKTAEQALTSKPEQNTPRETRRNIAQAHSALSRTAKDGGRG